MSSNTSHEFEDYHLKDDNFDRTPVGDEKPQPYRVRKVTHVSGGNREVMLPRKLEDLYNEQAKEGYHPIRVEPITTMPGFVGPNTTFVSIYGYLVTFYYAPNGPAFTPPF